jgi:hypothetical protein
MKQESISKNNLLMLEDTIEFEKAVGNLKLRKSELLKFLNEKEPIKPTGYVFLFIYCLIVFIGYYSIVMSVFSESSSFIKEYTDYSFFLRILNFNHLDTDGIVILVMLIVLGIPIIGYVGVLIYMPCFTIINEISEKNFNRRTRIKEESLKYIINNLEKYQEN